MRCIRVCGSKHGTRVVPGQIQNCAAVAKSCDKQNCERTAPEWRFLGNGRGSYEKADDYEFAGEGCGSWEPVEVTHVVGWRVRPVCVAMLSVLLTCGVAVLVLVELSTGSSTTSQQLLKVGVVGNTTTTTTPTSEKVMPSSGPTTLAPALHPPPPTTWAPAPQLAAPLVPPAVIVEASTTGLQYDCDLDYFHWETAWTDQHQHWCCVHVGRPCQAATQAPPATWAAPPPTTRAPTAMWAPMPTAVPATSRPVGNFAFDCTTVAISWTIPQEVWCCSHDSTGRAGAACVGAEQGETSGDASPTPQQSPDTLTPMLYNCEAGTFVGWTEGKKAWCCTHDSKYCVENTHA
mmetsp:Transcript_85682/g.223303  ORF Transcript_85682/g.223303 Transcript_85682/m.223303 type:complete len:347 (-) Transcript_85682:245-1285(-)